MKFTEAVRLYLDAKRWKINEDSIFEDCLITTDGLYRTYADNGISIREAHIFGHDVFRANLFQWTITLPLSKLLMFRVKRREKRRSQQL